MASVGPAEEKSPPKASSEEPGKASAGGGGDGARSLLDRLFCRRRQAKPQDPREEWLTKYRELMLMGRKVADKRKDWYDKLAWWSDCTTKSGARIFVLVPRGPKGEHDIWIYMWELVAFAVSKMHEHVVIEDKPFAIVWVQFGDHRMWLHHITHFRSMLHPKFAKNFDALHVVHPSWSVRILRLLLWPVAPDDFWDKFHAHERIEFMDSSIDLRKFRLPKDVYEHDKYLDKQALEMNEQAKNRGLGGFGANMVNEDDQKKQKEQMEELRRLMEDKGYGGKKQD
mmetsp:Transcript_44741/g.100456  ORF Transcript_44741/g.100456 Transcript_44741/m.100456 type:complete len:283 (+) Transcript_44741:54-902(+)